MLALAEALWKKALMYFVLLLLFYNRPGKLQEQTNPAYENEYISGYENNFAFTRHLRFWFSRKN